MMVNNKPTVFFPIETKNREFDARLLLTLHLISKGFNVLLGPWYAINRELRYINKGKFIFIPKSITGNLKEYYKSINDLGGRIAVIDEEGNVFNKDEDLLIKSLIPAEVQKYIWMYFASGPKIKDIMQKNSMEILDENIIVTGNPRFDFLKPKFSEYFKADIISKKLNYGKYILINTNFSLGNNYKGWDNKIRETAKDKGFLPELKKLIYNKMEWQKENIDIYIDMIKEMARRFSDKTIIIRPHPSENTDYYTKRLKGFKNIRINKQNSIALWISGAALVIHYECTTGIEAKMAQKPVIAYTPNRNDKLINWLTVELSDFQIENKEQLFDLMDKILSSKDSYELNEEKSKTLSEYIVNAKIESAPLIVNAIDEQINKNSFKYIDSDIFEINRQQRFQRWVKRKRGIFNKIKRKLYIKDEALHQCPYISQKEIYEKLDTLKDIENIKTDFSVKNFGIDAYLIESYDG